DNGTPADPGDDFLPAPDLGADGVSNAGDVDGNGRLDPGETWTYRRTDLPAVVGQYSNLARVTGRDVLGGTLGASDPANYSGVPAAIRVAKRVNGDDADTPTGPLVATGCPVTFTYTVTNPGQLPLSGVTLVDDDATPGNPADDFSPTFLGGDAD